MPSPSPSEVKMDPKFWSIIAVLIVLFALYIAVAVQVYGKSGGHGPKGEQGPNGGVGPAGPPGLPGEDGKTVPTPGVNVNLYAFVKSNVSTTTPEAGVVSYSNDGNTIYLSTTTHDGVDITKVLQFVTTSNGMYVQSKSDSMSYATYSVEGVKFNGNVLEVNVREKTRSTFRGRQAPQDVVIAILTDTPEIIVRLDAIEAKTRNIDETDMNLDTTKLKGDLVSTGIIISGSIESEKNPNSL
jgi:hypothetical protein